MSDSDEVTKLLADERWEDALSAIESFARSNPDSDEPHRMRCVALENLERYDEALAAAQAAVAVAPTSSNSHYFLGRAFWMLSRDAEARAAFEQAIALEDDVPLYRVKLAELVFESDPMTAETLLQRVVRDEPQRAAALNDLGVLLERRGELRRAGGMYKRAVAADRTLLVAKHNDERIPWPLSHRSMFRWLIGVIVLIVPGIPLAIAAWAHSVRWAVAGGVSVLLTVALVRGARRVIGRYEAARPKTSFALQS